MTEAEKLQAALDALETKLKNANKEEVDALKLEIKELKEKEVPEFKIEENEQYKALQSQVNKMALTQKENKEAKKGEIVTFVEKNIEDKTPDTNKDYRSSTVIKAAALMETANVLDNVTGGFNQLFGNFVVGGIGSVPKPDLLIMPLVDVTSQPGTENVYWVDRVNEEGDAAFVDEGALAPLADGEYQEYKEGIKEVALYWKQTKRLIAHAPSVVTDIAVHTNELMEQKIDDKIYAGNATTTPLEVDGIVTKAGAFVVPAKLANFYYSANIFDAITAVATQVRLANFKGALTCTLNTVWGAIMLGYKADDGQYINIPFASPDGKTVGEVKVVFSNKADADVITLGDYKKFHVVISENVMYDEGYENDDFTKRLVSKSLNGLMGTYMRASDAGSIISDDIATVLTAIEEVAA